MQVWKHARLIYVNALHVYSINRVCLCMRVLNGRYQSVQDWTVHFIVFEDVFLKWKKTQSIVVHYLVVKPME